MFFRKIATIRVEAGASGADQEFPLEGKNGGRSCKGAQYMVRVAANHANAKVGFKIKHGPDGQAYTTHTSIASANIPTDKLYVFDSGSAMIGGDLGRDAYGDATGEFRAGLAVKRIALADLDAVADAPSMLDTMAHIWDVLLDQYGVDVTIEGELLGRVRVWIRDEEEELGGPDGRPRFRAFGRVLCEGGKLIDPAAATCGGRLSLYFPVSACETADSSAAIWRATAFEADDAERPSGATFGRDFLVDVTVRELSSRKRLLTSPDRIPFLASGQYLNPEVIQMPGGSWWLQTSGNLFTGTSEDGGCGPFWYLSR